MEDFDLFEKSKLSSREKSWIFKLLNIIGAKNGRFTVSLIATEYENFQGKTSALKNVIDDCVTFDKNTITEYDTDVKANTCKELLILIVIIQKYHVSLEAHV